jgi:RNA polymerase sigma-70 factor (ECF subfamily)
VALNTALTGKRKDRLGRLTTYVEEMPVQVVHDDRAAEVRDQEEQLRRAIGQLSGVEKSIVMLYLEEKTYEEMEAILGIKVVNLRVKMNRIKDKLRKLTHTPV